jgi:site-specific DNA recombinase
MPEQRRAVAYIRESTEEQGRGYSPEGQRQAIVRHADESGLNLVGEYVDFETGRHADKRPAFQRLIADAMERRFECVLVFHTSRFARNTIEAKRYRKLLRSQLGIDVVSVTQPLGAADDPAAFLSESVHEIFDEYYSVSLSFWTRMGLKEKARQGHLTGSLPWGYRRGEDGMAEPDPGLAPFVRQLFELYATGRHSDRSLAAWLNARHQKTARGREFGADTVREMLRNAAYCGYVSARRDIAKQIRGLHEPIVDEALFDRVQELRRLKATVLKPGRPSTRYVLRGLARCGRCEAPMQGTAVGRKGAPRYYCATRRKQHSCDQPLVHAPPVESQLIEFVSDFKPSAKLRARILERLASDSAPDDGEAKERRRGLEQRLARLRDLYELGDIPRAEYLGKREAIQTELAQLVPPPPADLSLAERVLSDFRLFWEHERDHEVRSTLLQQIFDCVWLDAGGITAVRPKAAFAPFFTGQAEVCKERERRDSNPRPPA